MAAGTPNGFSPNGAGFVSPESLFDNTPPAEDTETRELAPIEAEVDDAKDNKAVEDSKGEEKPEEDSPEESDEEEAEESADEKKKEAFLSKAPVRGKFQGENVDVPAQATFPVTIDGKKEFVTFQALQSSYSSQAHLRHRHDKQVEEEKTISREKETLSKQTSQIRDFVTNVTSLADKNDIWGMLGHFAEVAGKDPYEFTAAVRKGVIDSAIAYSQLPDAEKQLWEERTKNEFTRQKLDRIRAKDVQSQEIQELNRRAYESMKEKGVGEDEYRTALSDISKQLQNGELKLDKGQQVTPEYVANWAWGQKKFESFKNALEKHGESLVSDHEKVRQMMNSVIRFELEDEDIEKFVKSQAEEVDTKTARQLSEKKNVSQKPKRNPNIKATNSDWDWVDRR